MNVHSSISSSETAAERLPHLRWITVLGCALVFAGAFVIAMEVALAARGFRPTIADSEAQWDKQRARAAALGSRALILVGDSRMQTDLDLDVIVARTGLAPVELAIDGSSFVPVLAGLAKDGRITGTVLVGFSDAEVSRWNSAGASAHYETDYDNENHALSIPNYRSSEGWLDDRLHALLASYADGARPLTTLLMRVIDSSAAPQNVMTWPDRTRVIDFSHSDLRSLNVRSALFELEGNANGILAGSVEEREAALRSRIQTLRPADISDYTARNAEIQNLTQEIQKRGGRVIFVSLPTGGFVSDIDTRLYPRALFWDRFAERSSALCIRFDEDSRLRSFVPPDGLHLDNRDRKNFTNALIEVLGLAHP